MRAVLQTHKLATGSCKQHVHSHFWVSLSIVLPLLLDIAFHEITLRTSCAALRGHHPVQDAYGLSGHILGEYAQIGSGTDEHGLAHLKTGTTIH